MHSRWQDWSTFSQRCHDAVQMARLNWRTVSQAGPQTEPLTPGDRMRKENEGFDLPLARPFKEDRNHFLRFRQRSEGSGSLLEWEGIAAFGEADARTFVYILLIVLGIVVGASESEIRA